MLGLIDAENIKDIKEKIRKNPKYLHPCNKEFQDDAKKLGLNGYQYIRILKSEGILKNDADILRKEYESWAKNKGYKDYSEYQRKERREYKAKWTRENGWNKGINIPMSENEECSSYFGVHITESLVFKLFESEDPDIKRVPYGTIGYDWICKQGKIQHKARCITFDNKCGWCGWKYHIDRNKIADIHVLTAWDNRDNLNPMYVWIFEKGDILEGEKFWNRIGLTITNTPKGLFRVKKFEDKDKFEKLKKLCREHIDEFTP